MSSAANPRADNPQQGGREATGAVTSDSLAAESMKSGGGFAENEDAAVSSVKGSNSTFNTTDTSGATALHPARDGAAREKQDAQGLGSDEKGVSGVKYDAANNADFSGTVSDQGYVGGTSDATSGYKTTTGGTASGATGDSFADGGAGITSSSDTKTADTSSETQAVDTSSGEKTAEVSSGSTATGVSGSSDTSDLSGGTTSTGLSGSTSTKPTDTSSGSGATGQASTSTDKSSSGSSGQGGPAPNYAGVVSGAIQSEGQNKVKGENLTEGDIPQTKTFTGNVGGDKDPGRLAEKDFQKVSAQNTASAGGQQYSGSGAQSTTGGAFDVLSSERAPDTSDPSSS